MEKRCVCVCVCECVWGCVFVWVCVCVYVWGHWGMCSNPWPLALSSHPSGVVCVCVGVCVCVCVYSSVSPVKHRGVCESERVWVRGLDGKILINCCLNLIAA